MPSAVTAPSANPRRPGSTPSRVPATPEPVEHLLAGVLDRGPVEVGPELAAVAEVLGTLSVRVGASRTVDSGTPRAVAATWSIFVCSPWPISVPPWVTSTEPSL